MILRDIEYLIALKKLNGICLQIRKNISQILHYQKSIFISDEKCWKN